MRVDSFLNYTNFLSNKQFGFRKSKGTQNALLEFTNFLYKGLDRRDSIAAIFVDFTKAFDTVNPSVLLEKLSHAGFRGITLEWFRSYLCERSQVVKIGDTTSQGLTVNDGVPQGSVLGPLLFLIYLNSIFDINFNSQVIAFADDLVFLYSHPERGTNILNMKSDLNLLRNWCLVHTMFLSTKTKGMFFKLIDNSVAHPDIIYHKANCDHETCNEGCVKIEFVESFRYLGLIVDTNMTWKQHIVTLHKYMIAVIRKFYILRTLCPTAVLKSIYFALVDSKLSYGLVCWGGTYYIRIYPLIIAQKHIIRVMLNAQRMAASWPLFQSLEILPLRHLFVFKVMKAYLINNNIWLGVSTGYNLRDDHYIRLPKFNTTNFKNSFLILAPKIFNNLPAELQIQRNLKTFSGGLKLFLLVHDTVDGLMEFKV